MVIRGNIRGNGAQLAQYLLTEGDNERVEILEVAGRGQAKADYLHQTLRAMSMTAELTKSQKGLYHAQINPAYNEDRRMSEADWSQAADILAHELGLSEQRRVIVLHTKKNRTHAHVVFERYDLETGKIIDHKFSRLAQDRARKEMERVFEHQPTPHRNKHRPELKETLTKLWQQTETGPDFIWQVHAQGYLLAEGVPRHPFMVVDQEGRSFDLVRQLQGVRIKEVRQRLRDAKLMPEKDAIELMRQRQEGGSDASKAEPQRDTDQEKAIRTGAAFWNNKQETTFESTEAQSQKRMLNLADSFIELGQQLTGDTEQTNSLEKKKRRVGAYLLNADELTSTPQATLETDTLPNQFKDYIETKEILTTKPPSDESGQRQQRKAEEFAINSDEVSQHSVSPEKKQQREKLREFMQSEDELIKQEQAITEGATIQRQQAAARQFFENEAMTAPKSMDDSEDIQKLMQEQKEVRERKRQRNRRIKR